MCDPALKIPNLSSLSTSSRTGSPPKPVVKPPSPETREETNSTGLPGISTSISSRLPPIIPGVSSTPKIIVPSGKSSSRTNTIVRPKTQGITLGPVRVPSTSSSGSPPASTGFSLPRMRPGAPIPKSSNPIYSLPPPRLMTLDSKVEATSSPIRRSPSRPKSSQLNWDSIDTILREESAYLPPELPQYERSDVEKKVDLEYLCSLFQELERLGNDGFRFFLRNLDGQCCLIREWINSGCRFRFYITETNFAFAFESPSSFLVLSHSDGHSFVATPDFSFYDGDRKSYISTTLFPSLDLEGVKSILKERVKMALL